MVIFDFNKKYDGLIEIDLLNKLQAILNLKQVNFKVQLDKSKFLQTAVKYLRHVIPPLRLKPNPNKISAIQNYPIPFKTLQKS